jgi:hypothetical protein
MIAAACLAALLASAPARAAEDPIECPSGTHRITTNDPYQPFRCVSDDDEKKAFGRKLGCPSGTHPVADGISHRCVWGPPASQDPELVPIDGAPAPAATARSPRRALGAYGRYSIPRQIAFEYPTAFHIQDAWTEDVPTLYLRIDDDAAGKPVTITITRYAKGQNGYQEMSAAIAHDVEWQGAKDAGTQTVARARARVTAISGDTRSVYLPVSKESYYSFVYSAPADSYSTYLPVFSRLLKSLKLGGNAR